MKTITALVLLAAATLAAQSVETIPFRAVLSAKNETTPIVDATANGNVTVLLHVIRDANGKITAGSVDFNAVYRFAGATSVTAAHIHKGAVNVAGPVVIGLPFTRIDDPTGTGPLPLKQVQFTKDDAVPMDTVNGMLADAAGFYFNIHTTDAPAGAMRGQLQRADRIVLMGIMSPANEVPPVPLNAQAVATAIIIRTPDSAYVTYDVNYSGFPADTSFTGLHIHNGVAGANAGVVLDSGLSARTAVPAGATGAGNLHYEFEADMTRAFVPQTLDSLFSNPAAAYINVHTTANPAGVARSQLHRTDHAVIQVTANPKEEVATPPITIEASAPSAIHIYTLRNPDGTIPAGAVTFDVNPTFPPATTITAMHIHDATAGNNGPVTIDSRLNTLPALNNAGTGNIYSTVTVSTASALSSLNDLVLNPEKHYLNLHTTVFPAGVIRGQLAPATTDKPLVSAAISSVYDITRTVAANKSLMSIYGLRLAKVGANLEGFLQLDSLPKTINGTSVSIGGTGAGLLLVSPEQVIAEVPAEAAAGDQPVVITSSSGASNSFTLPVKPSSPNIFFDTVGGLITKGDFSLIRPANPAAAGDTLLIFSTGNGQTTPPLATARVAPLTSLFNAPAATVTIGGQNATVLYSVAAPGFAGLYQTGVRMPAGVAAGPAAVKMTVGGVESNSVNIAVR